MASSYGRKARRCCDPALTPAGRCFGSAVSAGLDLSRSDAKPRIPLLPIQAHGRSALTQHSTTSPRCVDARLRLWTHRSSTPAAASLGPRLDGRAVEIRHRRGEFSQTTPSVRHAPSPNLSSSIRKTKVTRQSHSKASGAGPKLLRSFATSAVDLVPRGTLPATRSPTASDRPMSSPCE